MIPTNPGTPQMGQVQMMQHNGYPPFMGGPQVNRHFSSSAPNFPRGNNERGRSGKIRGRGGQNFNNSRFSGNDSRGGPRNPHDPALQSPPLPPAVVFGPPVGPLPDLSPESGNFESFLTLRNQQGHVQFMTDPSIQYNVNQQWIMQGYMPPSPRPNFAQGPPAPYMQPTHSGQGQSPYQPQPMSRSPSQRSGTDRPASSMSSAQTPMMAPTNQQAAPRPGGSPAPPKTSSNFQLPSKKSSALVIKNDKGEVVNPTKPAPAPAPAPAQPTIPAKTSTPPAAASSSQPSTDASHFRTESVSTKTNEEKKKEMQEKVKKAAEEAKAKQEQEEVEKKATKEKEDAEVTEAEAPKAQEAAEAQEDVHQPEPVVSEPSSEPEKPAERPSPPAADSGADEIDFDALEAELAAKEAEEEAREAEYQRKKEAEKEVQERKELEEKVANEANMKRMEREAEEREEALAKKRSEAGSDSEDAKLFAALRAHADAPTPTSNESPGTRTPAESGTATPVSDLSMGPPTRAKKDKKPADLTLNTSKAVEPPQPSAALKSLHSARFLEDPSKIEYPLTIASPNPALNSKAPADRRFKYDKEFLLQFQSVFKEKPSLDWDVRVRETLGDGGDSATAARASSARTPAGMGSRSVSNRPSVVPSFGQMGTFGAAPRAGPTQLPPGTSSAQRFALSNAALAGQRNPVPNPFEAFGRPQGLPVGGGSISRSSSSNVLGGTSPSTRAGGSTRGGTRAGSKRDKAAQKKQEEEDKSMPMTAGMDIKPITVSAGGWKPRSVGQIALAGPALGGEGLMAPDVVQRKVKASLNKMTPEKFDKISDQILEIAAQSKDETDGRTLRQVIQLTFEKATDEAHWAPMYAMFCKRMLESMSADIKDENIKDKHGNVVTGGNLFRKYLLNRCQDEFERGWKVNLPPKPEGQMEEAAMMSDEYYVAATAKRRGLGLVKFIGELYKLGMLTERIMHECVKKLLDYEGVPDEAEVESLTSLLRTVGANLDNPESRAQPAMNVYFARIHEVMNLPELPSRLKFMLMVSGPRLVSLSKMLSCWVGCRRPSGTRVGLQERQQGSNDHSGGS